MSNEIPDIARRLLSHPLWRAEDLGEPIPDSPHAVSACLPTWRDNIGYEEQEPRVMHRLTTGYPRFVYNQLCQELFGLCEARFADAGEQCLAFPSRRAAEACAECIAARTATVARTEQFVDDVWAVCFDRAAEQTAKSFWQHTGCGIGSRQAESSLRGIPSIDGSDAKRQLCAMIAEQTGAPGDHVFLFPNGMNAMWVLHRALLSVFPERRSVQFGFPYVDSLKIQQVFGPGADFYPHGNAADLRQLEGLAANSISAIYTELPANPLLVSPDLHQLRSIADRIGCALVVDDTVASFVNVDALPIADVTWSSLTKYVSGVGDVTGGALVVNPHGRFRDRILEAVAAEWEDVIWGADAVRLLENSTGFVDRVKRINATAERLAEFLAEHTRVSQVHYPTLKGRDLYDAFRRPGGGYGGLLSLELHDAAQAAPRFYDALRVSKGPNLGTMYTLACPFTILAHYRELDFAEQCGVSRWLIRVSVGLEDADDLIERFNMALDQD